MKNLQRVLLAMVAIVAVAMPSSAQMRFGIRGGLNVDKITISDNNLSQNISSDNRTGWQLGLMTEFTVPIVGIGFDASVLYVQRNKELSFSDQALSYIEVPVNLKYKLSLPAVGAIVTPFIATGPSFAVKCSKEDLQAGIKDHKFDVSWNAAVGAELLRHLQIGVGYSWGITKLYETTTKNEPIDIGKLNGWVITAAYMF